MCVPCPANTRTNYRAANYSFILFKLFIHSSIYLYIHFSFLLNLFTHVFVNTTMHRPFFLPSSITSIIHPSIHRTILPSIHPFIHPSFHPITYFHPIHQSQHKTFSLRLFLQIIVPYTSAHCETWIFAYFDFTNIRKHRSQEICCVYFVPGFVVQEHESEKFGFIQHQH